jgi:hypothetical protein
MGVMSREDDPNSPNPRAVRLGLAIVAIGSALFFAAWWNRYVAPTGGGELIFTRPWGRDLLPYRDTYYQGPPGMPMLIQAIQLAFGPYEIALLTVGRSFESRAPARCMDCSCASRDLRSPRSARSPACSSRAPISPTRPSTTTTSARRRCSPELGAAS